MSFKTLCSSVARACRPSTIKRKAAVAFAALALNACTDGVKARTEYENSDSTVFSDASVRDAQITFQDSTSDTGNRLRDATVPDTSVPDAAIQAPDVSAPDSASEPQDMGVPDASVPPACVPRSALVSEFYLETHSDNMNLNRSTTCDEDLIDTYQHPLYDGEGDLLPGFSSRNLHIITPEDSQALRFFEVELPDRKIGGVEILFESSEAIFREADEEVEVRSRLFYQVSFSQALSIEMFPQNGASIIFNGQEWFIANAVLPELGNTIRTAGGSVSLVQYAEDGSVRNTLELIDSEQPLLNGEQIAGNGSARRSSVIWERQENDQLRLYAIGLRSTSNSDWMTQGEGEFVLRELPFIKLSYVGLDIDYDSEDIDQFRITSHQGDARVGDEVLPASHYLHIESSTSYFELLDPMGIQFTDLWVTFEGDQNVGTLYGNSNGLPALRITDQLQRDRESSGGTSLFYPQVAGDPARPQDSLPETARLELYSVGETGQFVANLYENLQLDGRIPVVSYTALNYDLAGRTLNSDFVPSTRYHTSFESDRIAYTEVLADPCDSPTSRWMHGEIGFMSARGDVFEQKNDAAVQLAIPNRPVKVRLSLELICE